MTNIDPETEEEKPLDPEMEKVRRKMVRLLAVSLGVMFIGVMAVLVGVVYKVMETPEEEQTASTGVLTVPTGESLEVKVKLPQGFIINDVSLDGSRVLFFGENTDGSRSAYIFDVQSLSLVAQIAIER